LASIIIIIIIVIIFDTIIVIAAIATIIATTIDGVASSIVIATTSVEQQSLGVVGAEVGHLWQLVGPAESQGLAGQEAVSGPPRAARLLAGRQLSHIHLPPKVIYNSSRSSLG